MKNTIQIKDKESLLETLRKLDFIEVEEILIYGRYYEYIINKKDFNGSKRWFRLTELFQILYDKHNKVYVVCEMDYLNKLNFKEVTMLTNVLYKEALK